MTTPPAPQPPPHRAFTVRHNGQHALTLTSPVHVFPAFVPPAPPTTGKQYLALYDTGATLSAISPRVVADLALASIGTANVGTAKGRQETSTHFVNIGLPNHVLFHSIRVIKADLDPAIDVLVGMDLLGEGDFAVTNVSGHTVFTYCYPSRQEIDFVTDITISQQPPPAHSNKVGRNEPCPCNSGKKFKKCCGRQPRSMP